MENLVTNSERIDLKTTLLIDAMDSNSKDTTLSRHAEEIRAELEKEYKAKLQKETDKRVTEALKKREREYADQLARERLAEERRKKAEEEERAQKQAEKDNELIIKGLRLDLVEAIVELGLDIAFRNFITIEDLAPITDENERNAKLLNRIKGIKSILDREVARAVANAKSEFLRGDMVEIKSGGGYR